MCIMLWGPTAPYENQSLGPIKGSAVLVLGVKFRLYLGERLGLGYVSRPMCLMDTKAQS